MALATQPKTAGFRPKSRCDIFVDQFKALIAHIRVFITQVGMQHCIKMKIHDKRETVSLEQEWAIVLGVTLRRLCLVEDSII